MNKPIILVGLGEMGAVFARGFLRLGHPVYPVNRDTDIQETEALVTDPEAVLVAVGENDLQPVLSSLPDTWKGRLILLQNELLPKDFANLPDPTVVSVWFEKKKGQDSKVIIPSPAFGPKAGLLQEALSTIDIPVRQLNSAAELEFELVVKNLYILTSNIAGLKTGGTVGELWQENREIAECVANDVIALQQALTGNSFDRQALIDAMLLAFDGDPEHKCMGRSAPDRLRRALDHSTRQNIETPCLAQIAAEMH